MSETHLQSPLPVTRHLPLPHSRAWFYPPLLTEGVSPYDELQWERRTASITDTKGNSIFEQNDVEVPVDWSMTATNIVASKYLHGQMGTPERETGVRQLVAAWLKRFATGALPAATSPRLKTLPSSTTSWPPCCSRRAPPSIRRCGSTWAATGWSRMPTARTGTGTRPPAAWYSATGYKQPAVLGLLHQRGRRLARLHPDPGQD